MQALVEPRIGRGWSKWQSMKRVDDGKRRPPIARITDRLVLIVIVLLLLYGLRLV